MAKSYLPDGFHSVTPYLVNAGAKRLLEFLKAAFDAEELICATRPDGSIVHAGARIGDSMVEMGEPVEPRTMVAALHLYVPDADATYARAIAAGAKSLYEPQDMNYGDREAGVIDPTGNHWYIATHKAGQHFAPQGLRSVTPGFSVRGAAQFLIFLEKAFSAQVMSKHEVPAGTIVHAKARIGDSAVELSEAHGEWGPRTATLHLYMPDVDAVYHAALAAGGTSLAEPKNQFYGERSGGIKDAWGNHWYVATHREDLTSEELAAHGAAQGESVK
jgi:PhnB protein